MDNGRKASVGPRVSVAALVALCLIVALGGSATASRAQAGGHRAGSGQITALALCDYGGLSAAQPAFVASHFSWVVLGGGSTATVAQLHALSPAIRVLYYFDALLTPTSQSAAYPGSAFLMDPVLKARLVTSSSGPGLPTFPTYVMDPSSPTWLAATKAQVASALADGYDGVLFDMVLADLTEVRPYPQPEGFPPYSSVPSWYNASAYFKGVRTYLQKMSSFVKPKVDVFNGLTTFPGTPELPLTKVSGGAVQEGWVYDDRYGADYVTGAQWAAMVNSVAAVPMSKRFAAMSYGASDLPDARLYALGSYLLVERSNSTFSYAPDCTSLGYYPEYDVALGAPLRPVRSLASLTLVGGQVYERDFANGTVLVNPQGTAAPPIALGRTCRQVVPQGGTVPALGGDGSLTMPATTSVTLSAHSAAILTNCV